MNTIININERGTLTLPKEVRKKLGVSKAGQVLLGCDENGQVTLRPCATFPIEIYSDARISEFSESDKELEKVAPQIQDLLEKARKNKGGTTN